MVENGTGQSGSNGNLGGYLNGGGGGGNPGGMPPGAFALPSGGYAYVDPGGNLQFVGPTGGPGNPGSTPGPWAGGYNSGNPNPTSSPTGGPGGSLFDWTKLGVGALGSYLSGANQTQMSQLQALVALLQQQMTRQDTSAVDMSNYLSGQQGLDKTIGQKQSQVGLDSTQMDPYAQAKDLNAANVRSSFATSVGGNPNAKMSTPLDMSALSPTSLQNSADTFYSMEANANPNVPVGNQSPTAEQFRQTNNTNTANQQAKLTALIQQYLASIGAPVQNPPQLPQVP
jgi:hypothetical protein